MEDTTKEQAEQTHSAEEPGTETPTPDEKSDRDELKEASQQFFRTLIRAGVHLATTSVNMLPEDPGIFRERWARIYSWAGNVCTRTCGQCRYDRGRGEKGYGLIVITLPLDESLLVYRSKVALLHRPNSPVLTESCPAFCCNVREMISTALSRLRKEVFRTTSYRCASSDFR